GDITHQAVDALVNAANEALAPGGGVCGAIMRAAGPELAEACARIGGCATGDAVATPAFALPARHVIHAVGPVWRGGGRGEERLLADCHRAAVARARELGCRSMALPAISTGIYGFPVARAAPIALAALRAAAGPPLELIRVVLFTDTDLAAYARARAAPAAGA
ncbi:MAG TPA: macro domain-containing protein, partial [Miltoncostaeaceae bacterium]|nr:macro domain-containing protein [Miltoncostaeaceae bacterium]